MKLDMESMIQSYLASLKLLAAFRDEQLEKASLNSQMKVWEEYAKEAELLRKLIFKSSDLTKRREVQPLVSRPVVVDDPEKRTLRVVPTIPTPFDLSMFGEMAESKGKDFSTIIYATPGLAANARRQISNRDLGWKLVGEIEKEPSLKEVEKEEAPKPFVPQDPTSLLVSIPSKVGTEEIRNFFNRFGKIEFSAITTDGDHLILYEDARDAKDAKYCLQQGQMPGWILME